ncbi:glycosyltransferase family A protein [Bordetella sp. 15P40C-2]|uniref:glycosyltransferase family A protein n=1 Tax=Bordetella sp. 15P40C-2 TaxID=2572246 RepID=UPI001365FB41|nr:glycosyltransferase family A protein [Bordetella sp. 15P40C-2]
MLSDVGSVVRLLAQSELFDRNWYLAQYPDVALLDIDAVEHFVKLGWRLGRDPSPNFSTEKYLERHPELRESAINPLAHYLANKSIRTDSEVDGNKTLPSEAGKPQIRRLVPSETSKPRKKSAAGIKWSEQQTADAKLSRIDELFRFRRFADIFYVEEALRRSKTIEDKVILSYLRCRLNSSFRIFGRVIRAGEYLSRSKKAAAILGEARCLNVSVLFAKALTRLGSTDAALRELERWESSSPLAITLAKIDIQLKAYPQAALESLAGLADRDEVPFSYKILYAELLLSRDQVKSAIAFLNKLNPDSPEKDVERSVALINAYISDRQSAAANQTVCNLYRSMELPVPEVGSGQIFSIANIKNTVVPTLGSEHPEITVLMTTYNSAAVVEHSINSVLAQTFDEFELIIVDDCSSDGTREILRRYASLDGRIKLIFNDSNMGTYASKNKGVMIARGAFVTCHDSDDWMHPMRLQLHFELMQKRPEIVASRSKWLRISESGTFSLTRWQREYMHFNPASPFIRREVFQEIGLFDEVRAGADSEFWARLTAEYGRKKLAGISKALTLGLHHASSLTTSGATGVNEEVYSPVRETYAEQWLAWHRRALSRGRLCLPLQVADRAFPVPDELRVPLVEDRYKCEIVPVRLESATTKSTPNVVFGISLASAVVGNWEHTCYMLERTLNSLLRQTDGRFVVLVCGHERPDLDAFSDPRVQFIESDAKPPKDKAGYRKDKMYKRLLLANHLRKLGGGYFMPLDADDLVHCRLVEHILADDNRRGYSIRKGYALDWNNRVLGSVPGVWDASFDQVCGSSGIFYFSPSELPHLEKGKKESILDVFAQHGYWRVTSQELGRPLADVPFDAAIYVLNHSQNISFSLQRGDIRQKNILESVARHSVPDGESVLKDFLDAEFRF